MDTWASSMGWTGGYVPSTYFFGHFIFIYLSCSLASYTTDYNQCDSGLNPRLDKIFLISRLVSYIFIINNFVHYYSFM